AGKTRRSSGAGAERRRPRGRPRRRRATPSRGATGAPSPGRAPLLRGSAILPRPIRAERDGEPGQKRLQILAGPPARRGDALARHLHPPGLGRSRAATPVHHVAARLLRRAGPAGSGAVNEL
ncbi:MAG: hypothetical protein AVDCRST_MAG08-2102, partial [uncultured Acetobacteraceae bacterium]